MVDENSNLLAAQQWLWEKARNRSHNSDYGKTPEDFKFKAKDLTHLDIGFESGRTMVKAFYGTSKCFYLNIPEEHLDNWIQAGIELYKQNPFNSIKTNNTAKEKQNEQNKIDTERSQENTKGTWTI